MAHFCRFLRFVVDVNNRKSMTQTILHGQESFIHSTEALVLERLLRDVGITGPPGEHLPYWDQIPYTRFLFDFW